MPMKQVRCTTDASWVNTKERDARMPLERPFVIINVAVTADGKTDTVARRGAKISSPQDLARVDRLRAESDAIMVGGRTLLGDDPRLTVKSAELRAARRARGLTENPLKVGIASNAALRLDSRFLTAGPARVLLFTTAQANLPYLHICSTIANIQGGPARCRRATSPEAWNLCS